MTLSLSKDCPALGAAPVQLQLIYPMDLADYFIMSRKASTEGPGHLLRPQASGPTG